MKQSHARMKVGGKGKKRGKGKGRRREEEDELKRIKSFFSGTSQVRKIHKNKHTQKEKKITEKFFRDVEKIVATNESKN